MPVIGLIREGKIPPDNRVALAPAQCKWLQENVAGTRIIVQAFRARDGDTRASAASISFPDGRSMSLGNPQTEAAIAAAKKGGQ